MSRKTARGKFKDLKMASLTLIKKAWKKERRVDKLVEWVKNLEHRDLYKLKRREATLIERVPK